MPSEQKLIAFQEDPEPLRSQKNIFPQKLCIHIIHNYYYFFVQSAFVCDDIK